MTPDDNRWLDGLQQMRQLDIYRKLAKPLRLQPRFENQFAAILNQRLLKLNLRLAYRLPHQS